MRYLSLVEVIFIEIGIENERQGDKEQAGTRDRSESEGEEEAS